VSLGTLFNARPGFYRDCFEAFRGSDYDVVMSIGNEIGAESLGPPPSNVVVRSYVPQLEVLHQASAFVSHGGMNSVSESLYYGVPLVVVPQMGEQEMIANRVEQLGAGIRLDRDRITPDILREATARVLREPGFRQGAARIQQSFREAGGVGEAADAIRSLAAGRITATSGTRRDPLSVEP
jgi:MGT family glycosyltransferase